MDMKRQFISYMEYNLAEVCYVRSMQTSRLFV